MLNVLCNSNFRLTSTMRIGISRNGNTSHRHFQKTYQIYTLDQRLVALYELKYKHIILYEKSVCLKFTD